MLGGRGDIWKNFEVLLCALALVASIIFFIYISGFQDSVSPSSLPYVVDINQITFNESSSTFALLIKNIGRETIPQGIAVIRVSLIEVEANGSINKTEICRKEVEFPELKSKALTPISFQCSLPNLSRSENYFMIEIYGPSRTYASAATKIK